LSVRVGLDLDETISAIPELFALLSRALIEAGHEVHVITYREPGTEVEVREELDGYGVMTTGVHLPVKREWPEDFKERMARELELDTMFEDSPENLAAMPEGVRRFWLCDPDVFDLDLCVKTLRMNPS
jgi:hypothetical protein